MEHFNFQPVQETISRLFLSRRQFMIPRFQREYSWSRRNFEEFINDILDGLEINNGAIGATSYFVGTMLFVGNFTDNKQTEIQVVDGQQRLTTITILFSAMSEIFKKIGQEALSKTIFNYIMTKDDDGNEVRIIKTNTSHPYFAYYIQDWAKANPEEKPTTEEEKNIQRTFEYLLHRLDEKNIRKYFKDKKKEGYSDDIEYVEILKAIREQILGCTFVSISTDNFNQAYRIFEILNAKGKQLQFIDLVKNKIFEVVKWKESVDFADDKWKKIKKILESAGESSVGMGTFFRHYWASKYNQCGANKLYDDFLDKINPDENSYKKLIQDMMYNATFYAIILKPSRECFKNKKAYFWLDQSLKVLPNDFGVEQVRVAIMPIIIAKEKNFIDMKVFKATIIFLENFHFTYTAIISGMANKLDNLYSKFAIKFRSCDNQADCQEVITTHLIEKLTKLLPSFEQFRENFIKLTYTKKNTASNLKTRYVIRKLNAYYDDKELFDDAITVEHIVPEDRGDISINIGNLIALEEKLNGEAGNKDYSDKKAIYEKSEYKWPKSFVAKHAIWEPADIEIRAKEMAETYFDKILQLKR